MKLTNSYELMTRYAICQHCGSKNIGSGEGTLSIDDYEFQRTCKCGWEVVAKELSDGSIIETHNTEWNEGE